MKLQNMIIIFAIIIIPITLLLSIYIGYQTDSVALQTKYDTMLLDATYDAVIAFQSNTLNNENSSNKDTLRENILASLNTFTNSLAKNLGVGGYSKDYLMPYVPAIAYTLYDGFYIYSPINNLQEDGTTLSYEHVLKPYIYYSERIIQDDIDVIINYSLDNYITIYGKIGSDTVIKSGYLIETIPEYTSGETLSENISIINDTTKEVTIETRDYVFSSSHEKIYKDETGLFRVIDYKKQYTSGAIQDKDIDSDGNVITQQIISNDFKDYSANVYYAKASYFTNWVSNNLGSIEARKYSTKRFKQ